MTRSKHLIGLLAFTVVVAALAPTFAQAKPPESVANDHAYYAHPQYQLGPGEIPYLSQGIGVNKENFRGSAPTTPQRHVAIPYLSQGVGVTSAELFGVAADDRTFSRATPSESSQPVVKKDDGWSLDGGTSALAAFALTLGLLAGGASVAIWSNRRTRLSPA